MEVACCQSGVAQYVMKDNATFAITVQYKGEQRTTELPLIPA
jgi:hypothetical protein